MPGIGPKQAERMALHLLRASVSETDALVKAIRDVKERVHACSVCFDYSESPVCSICSDPTRDRRLLCVVEEPSDVTAIERSRGYRGLYHVLHGALSPLNGVGPESLRIQELCQRLKEHAGETFEVILATDPDTEGETTALYLHDLLKDIHVSVTRIALGVPMGGDLDYIDEKTLSSALRGRREFTHKSDVDL